MDRVSSLSSINTEPGSVAVISQLLPCWGVGDRTTVSASQLTVPVDRRPVWASGLDSAFLWWLQPSGYKLSRPVWASFVIALLEGQALCIPRSATSESPWGVGGHGELRLFLLCGSRCPSPVSQGPTPSQPGPGSDTEDLLELTCYFPWNPAVLDLTASSTLAAEIRVSFHTVGLGCWWEGVYAPVVMGQAMIIITATSLEGCFREQVMHRRKTIS